MPYIGTPITPSAYPWRDYQQALAAVAREQAQQRMSPFGVGPLGAPLNVMEQERLRAAQLYMAQHFPGYAGATQGKTIYAPRYYGGRGGGRRRSAGEGYPEGGYMTGGGYAPRVVGVGGAAPAAPVSTAVTIPRRTGDWIPAPETIEETVARQEAIGGPHERLTMPGWQPTRGGGYMYSGTKEGFADELAYRDALLEAGIPAEELEAYGAPASWET